jgi:hypothetical protein
VLVEIAAGFGPLLRPKLMLVLGLSMQETIGVGARIMLPLLGTLAGRPKIDQFSHAESRW